MNCFKKTFQLLSGEELKQRERSSGDHAVTQVRAWRRTDREMVRY